MNYEFLNNSINKDNIILPTSDKINPFLLKNNHSEILKAVDFISSEEKFLYIHGFLGTGKRQFINYICEFLDKDVIKLEYYCKESTVCDDILLAFMDKLEDFSESKTINLNAKITTMNIKLQQQISNTKKPFLIILHSFDDILEENTKLIKESLNSLAREDNVKLIISTRAMIPSVLGDLEENRKIFLKALSKDLFKEYLLSNQITVADGTLDDFYKYTRGYYYYTALTIKILQAMKIDLLEFLQKFVKSEMTFDSFLSHTYVNLIPNTIRNFFWFLRTLRHGLTTNALAVLELYDEFSIEYLKSNLMIFQVDDTIYVQDYFLQKIDISIPEKTLIKLHKYIINIYENQLKESLKTRTILISRQALRAEIEYHNNCILEIKNINTKKEPEIIEKNNENFDNKTVTEESTQSKIKKAKDLMDDNKYTDSIELFKKILETDGIDTHTVVEIRQNLAKLYKSISDYKTASHYYDLVETYYKQHKEHINLNYLYYDMTDLYFKMYKIDRAIETIKKVIYSVDTPQSLMVSSCTLLGNIYLENNNPEDAYSYFQKAIESLDENVEDEVLAELYFKYALANDDNKNIEIAFEYYNKCIAVTTPNSYKALAYSNLASCYFEQENFTDAKICYQKAYEIEKSNNNYDGIYYNSLKLAQLLSNEKSEKTLDYLIEAKKSAEFLNEEFYILESTLALGDYYYNTSDTYKESLIQYFKAKRIAKNTVEKIDISIIEQRIEDMKLRMNKADYTEIEKKYDNNY